MIQKIKTIYQKKRQSMICLIDESGSLFTGENEPFRVGFLLTCHPNRLESDISSLKKELPPRGRCREYHASEDDTQTRAMLRRLLCLNNEPRMYIVEWIKEKFSREFFSNGKLRVFQDTNPMIASFAITASQFAAAASAEGFSIVHFIAEATKVDIKSEHRSREQAFNSILRTIFEKQVKSKVPPPGTQTLIRVSTKRKSEYPPLSFVDYWLWAYGRYIAQDDMEGLPTELMKRTVVEYMTEEKLKAWENKGDGSN